MIRKSVESISPKHHSVSYLSLFLVFLRLGLSSFGGPIAHLGHFHQEFVKKRKWFAEDEFAEMILLCQSLPGPASSQVGMLVGLRKNGIFGSFISWLGFTLPSFLIMLFAGIYIKSASELIPSFALRGLQLVAVPIVLQAILSMTKNICRGLSDYFVLSAGMAACLLFPFPSTQLVLIFVTGVLGYFLLKSRHPIEELPKSQVPSNRISHYSVFMFCCVLILLKLCSIFLQWDWLDAIYVFFRSGSLVFGGGHVVLPLIQSEATARAWMSANDLLVGYGLAQSLPGPLFAFAAYVGGGGNFSLNPILSGIAMTLGLFLPGYLILLAAFSYWEKLRSNPQLQSSFKAISVVVIGILAASFIHPILTSSLNSFSDAILIALGIILLFFLRTPSWLLALVLFFSGLWIHK